MDEAVIAFLDAWPQSWQGLLWVSNLVVDPAYRRKGVGSRLIKAARRYAQVHNLLRVMLELQTKNYPAIAFVFDQILHSSSPYPIQIEPNAILRRRTGYRGG